MNKYQQFFFDHAPWSYDPATQSEFAGRLLGAIELADAERWAMEKGVEYIWSVSDTDSSFFSDETPPWLLYDCTLYMPCDECPSEIANCVRNAHTHVKASLSALDFGRSEYPSGPYMRVVEASLAFEARHELEHEEDVETAVKEAALLGTQTYTFDVTLLASFTIQANDEAEARAKLRAALDNTGAIYGMLDDEPIVAPVAVGELKRAE